MLARAHAFTIDGFQTHHVTVEVDVRPGLPGFVIVGLADTAVREARERIASAIRNSGYDFPPRRITANLAPADVPKAGPGLDLPLACAVLAASGQLPAGRLAEVALAGELGLDGGLRSTRGTLAIAEAARAAGLQTLALAPERSREAGLIAGLEIAAVGSLRSAVRVLRGGPADELPADGPPAEGDPERGPGREAAAGPDLGDVRGQRLAVRALMIAAAGGHNLLLSGAPGTGKTMLAQRLPSILPPLRRRSRRCRSCPHCRLRLHPLASCHHQRCQSNRRCRDFHSRRRRPMHRSTRHLLATQASVPTDCTTSRTPPATKPCGSYLSWRESFH